MCAIIVRVIARHGCLFPRCVMLGTRFQGPGCPIHPTSWRRVGSSSVRPQGTHSTGHLVALRKGQGGALDAKVQTVLPVAVLAESS